MDKVGDESMSIQIITFMKIKLGKTMDVVQILKDIPEVKEINYITGEFDLAIIIEATNQKKIFVIFSDHIDEIPWIIRSSSNLLLKRWLKK